ncbi:hypothetical protein AC1031_007990 [Aphanomyces cochlioides]|nr:hypothetical protein AC1031_007990 [Aphanomyces cochlioides]
MHRQGCSRACAKRSHIRPAVGGGRDIASDGVVSADKSSKRKREMLCGFETSDERRRDFGLDDESLWAIDCRVSFRITKLEIATTDVLEAKIRDLQEEMAELKEGKLAMAQSPQITQLQTELKELRTNMRSQGY